VHSCCLYLICQRIREGVEFDDKPRRQTNDNNLPLSSCDRCLPLGVWDGLLPEVVVSLDERTVGLIKAEGQTQAHFDEARLLLRVVGRRCAVRRWQ
jgi:hypothetical protein